MSKSCERCKEWDDYYYWNHMDDQDKHFFKVMVGDHFRHRLIIPDKFARHFKGNLSGIIKLEARNGSICNVEVTKNGNKLVLNSGWEAFASAHDLSDGDFLVFRYSANSHFKVLIFDPSGCEKPPSCVALCSLVETTRKEDPVEISGSMSHDHPMQATRNKRRARLRRGGLNGNKIMRDGSSSEYDLEALRCIFARFTRLNRVQIKLVEEKVRAIRSELPIFGAIMTKNRVSCKKNPALTICKEYAKKYLPHKDQIMILQRLGKRWEVQLHTNRKHKYCSLYRGWGQFVSNNGVAEGDICLFEQIKNRRGCTTMMNVHVIHQEHHG